MHQRQTQHKAGAWLAVQTAFADRAAAVALRNAAHQGQAQSHTAGALAGTGQTVELFKDALTLVFGHAGAKVLDADHGHITFAREDELDVARAALSKEVVEEYYAEESAKVLEPVQKFLAQHSITPVCRSEVGPAGETIAKIAENEKYDLIIMGTHGHGALGKLVMGSVSTQVLANCSVPVMLIR